jgi:protein tyrosine/serine phosphatase
MTRHLDFEGIENFRDFGGYDTRCGRGLKRGLLYRSANHAYASEADLQRLRDLGVKVIVDLRRPAERTREPGRRWDEFDAHVIENDLEEHHVDWAVLMARESRIDGDWFFRDSLQFYRDAPHAPRHVDLFRRYFQALGEADGPLVVHCAAGKDRTGMICAFTHYMTGVHADDLMADYLATNNEAKIAGRVAFLKDFIRDLAGHEVDDAGLRVAVSVHPEYLAAAMQVIEDQHGNLDAYLRDVLGVDDQLRSRIEARILG